MPSPPRPLCFVAMPFGRKSPPGQAEPVLDLDRKSTRLNSSHANISYAVLCLKNIMHLPPGLAFDSSHIALHLLAAILHEALFASIERLAYPSLPPPQLLRLY